MKKVLVIAPTYCRSNCATGQVARHFFPNFPTDKYRFTIICNERWGDVSSIGSCEIVKTPFYPIKDYICRFLFHTPLAHWGNTPDKEWHCWGKEAVKYALQLAQKEHFDYIHSICMPASAHVVAYELKKKLGIPWVAQFYDPWRGNPFRVLRTRAMIKYDKIWEERVAFAADVVIHPCETMRKYWIDQYGDKVVNKIQILPFATECPTIVNNQSRKTDKLIISHIGSFSKNRNSLVFLKALSNLPPEVKDCVQVNFVGNVTDEEKNAIKDLNLCRVVNLVGIISEQECYNYYENSDLFLIVDINCSPNLFYPSKILKYFCYQKPILGITTEQSVIRDELTMTGNYPFSYNDVDGIASFIKKAVVDYESLLTNDKDYGERFYSENVIKGYQAIIDSML